MGDVTREDMRDLRDDIVTRLNTGFSGVHTRMDSLNDRTLKGEVAQAATDVKVENIERERTARHGVTVSDLKWYVACATAGAALAWWLFQFLGSYVSQPSAADIRSDIVAVLMRIDQSTDRIETLQRQVSRLQEAGQAGTDQSEPDPEPTSPTFPEDERFVP